MYQLHLENFFTDKLKFQVFWKVNILTESRLKSDLIQMVQTDELLGTKKKQTYLISPTSREREDFSTDKEVSNFSGKFIDWTGSRLTSDCKQIVQAGNY